MMGSNREHIEIGTGPHAWPFLAHGCGAYLHSHAGQLIFLVSSYMYVTYKFRTYVSCKFRNTELNSNVYIHPARQPVPHTSKTGARNEPATRPDPVGHDTKGRKHRTEGSISRPIGISRPSSDYRLRSRALLPHAPFRPTSPFACSHGRTYVPVTIPPSRQSTRRTV